MPPAADTPAFAVTGPRIVITIGVHGSASTWVFNVARELMIAAFGAEQVLTFFSDNPAEVIGKRELLGRRAVWKSHHGGPNWDVFAWLSGARVVLSVRDPRDAALSLVERFGMELGPALKGIGDDCRRALQCAAAGCPVLRYEDHYFEEPATVAHLARAIGVEVSAATCARIFDTYRTDAVRAFAAGLEGLPDERRSGSPGNFLHDRVTQIHHTHIGDGRVGKWRERIDPAQHAQVTAFFAPFLQRFGYSQ